MSHLLGQGNVRAIHSRSDLHLPDDIADEVGELAGDPDSPPNLSHSLTPIQFTTPIGETKLSVPSDIANEFALTFLAHDDRAAYSGIEAVGPGHIDGDASGVLIGRFGDEDPTADVAGGGFRGNRSQVLHQVLRIGNAGSITSLDRKSGSDDGEVEVTQTHQGVRYVFHAPLCTLLAKSVAETLNVLVRALESSAILIDGVAAVQGVSP